MYHTDMVAFSMAGGCLANKVSFVGHQSDHTAEPIELRDLSAEEDEGVYPIRVMAMTAKADTTNAVV